MGDMNIHITWLTHVRTGPKKKIAAGPEKQGIYLPRPKVPETNPKPVNAVKSVHLLKVS